MKYLHGEVHKLGYRIVYADVNIMYEAGNHPLDSAATCEPRRGLSTRKLMDFCNQTGEEIAKELKTVYVGILED